MKYLLKRTLKKGISIFAACTIMATNFSPWLVTSYASEVPEEAFYEGADEFYDKASKASKENAVTEAPEIIEAPEVTEGLSAASAEASYEESAEATEAPDAAEAGSDSAEVSGEAETPDAQALSEEDPDGDGVAEGVEVPDDVADEDAFDEEVETPDGQILENAPSVIFEQSTDEVRVTVVAGVGVFPEGTTMEVVPAEDEETISKVSETVEDEKTKVTGVKAVEVTFYNAEHEEIEPNGPVFVTLEDLTRAKKEAAEAAEAAKAVHVDDKGECTVMEEAKDEEGNLVELPMEWEEEQAAENDQTVSQLAEDADVAFVAESFSTYALVYTVDFHWEVDGQEYEFSIPGGGFVSLGSIVDALGIIENDALSERAEDFVADVEALEFSDPELVWIGKTEAAASVGELKEANGLDVEYSADLTEEQIDEINAQTVEAGDWALISMRPFTSEEVLSVSMKNGEEFAVRVTDAQIKKTVISSSGEAFEITVTYGEDAQIPEGSELVAEEILPESEKYDEYYREAAELVGADGEERNGHGYGRLFDISIRNGEEEIEPQGKVQVSIRLANVPADETELNVVHFGEDESSLMQLEEMPKVESLSQDETTEEQKNAELRFETDSFSVYAVISTNTSNGYGLGGQKFAIVNHNKSRAEAVLGRSQNNNTALAAAEVRLQQNDGKTYVLGEEVTIWEFEHVSNNIYYIKAPNGQYMHVGDGTAFLSNNPQQITVSQSGSGLRLANGKYGLNAWNRTVSAGFRAGDYNDDASRFTLYGVNEIVHDWAEKISVTDLVAKHTEENPIQNVIIYTRIWNKTLEQFDYYAVTKDGSLIPVYDVGDSIGWSDGSGFTPEKWDMIVHTADGSANGYFDFLNETGYLLPSSQGIEAQDDQDDPSDLGINMEGWSKGEYGTTMRHWDAPNSAYYGFSYDSQTMKLTATTDESQQLELMFAVADPTQSPYANGQLHQVETLDGKAQGITIKMYDFDGTHLSNYRLPRSSEMTRVLGTNSEESTNENGVGYSKRNLVKPVLGSDGFPVASQTSISLGNLFNNNHLKAEANNLFVKQVYDETGYFHYDSSQNYAYLDPSTGKFVLYKEVAAPAMEGQTTPSGNKGNFFPFDSLEELARTGSVFTDRAVLYDGDLQLMSPDNPQMGETLYKVPYPNTSNYNSYFFGMTMEADFYQGPDGKDQNGDDTVYEFNGDDDMWVFIDGVRILDIGGCHGAVSGTINFTTGVVKVNGAYPFSTTIRQLFKDANRLPNGDPWNEAQAAQFFKGNTFADYTQHSFKMFYLERGAYASNLKVNFNLLTVEPGTFVLEKKLPESVQQEYGDTLFAYQIFVKEDGREVLYTPQEGKHVVYEGSGARVVPEGQEESAGFKKQYTIGGKTFQNVYLLKPDEAIIVPVADKSVQYYVREIGIDKAVYEEVQANGTTLPIEAIEGTENQEYPVWGAAVGTSTVQNRGRVTYKNIPREEHVHNLRIRKVIDSPVEDPDARFRLDVKLESWNTNGMVPYRNGIYYIVKTKENGEDQYYRYSGTTLVESDEPVPMRAGMSGSILIPAGYTILIKGLMASADFLVTENLTESTAGYTYVRTDVENAGPVQVDGSQGSIKANEDNQDPLVTVVNKPDNKLLVKKIWDSGEFVTNHADVYVALYKKDAQNPETLTMVTDSVRKLEWDAEKKAFITSYNIPGDLSQYVAREVKVTFDQSGKIISAEGVDEGRVITLAGETTQQSGTNGDAADSYVVHYETGEEKTAKDQDNKEYKTRTDTVTNTLPKVSFYKVNELADAGKKYLSGAVFALEDQQGNAVKDASGKEITFTSANDGELFKDKYFSDGVYYFRETNAPAGYNLLAQRIVLTVSEGTITVKMEAPGTTEYTNQITDGAGKVFRFEIMNTPGDELPATGGPGTRSFLYTGLALMLLAMMAGFVWRRKRT